MTDLCRCLAYSDPGPGDRPAHTIAGTKCGLWSAMRRHRHHFLSFSLAATLLGLLAGGAGCDGTSRDGGDGDGDSPLGRTTFGWRAVDSGLTPVWGGFVAEGGERPILVGGVAGTSGPVIDTAEIPVARNDGIIADELLSIDGARYCGCGFVDATRNELIVVGGRDGRFLDVETAAVIDLDDGTATPVADAGPAAFPVGCVAFFLPATGTGYVYSGLSSNRRAFGSGLFRWDGAARTFVTVDVAGATPAPRYDAAVHVEAGGGSALVLSGMGFAGSNVFHRDTWRFDGASETWTEVTTTNAPPGRRYAWSALAPDGDTLVYGLGSDSPQGLTLFADLWRLSLASGVWTRLDDDASAFDVDTALPARGFASRLPGLPGTAGLLSGGMQDGVLAEDAFVLDVPAELDGDWR